MNITEEIFAGNIRPAEKSYISDNYSKAQSKHGKYYNEIVKLLPENKRETLEKLLEITSEMEQEFRLEMFRTGLALGVQMTAECFKKEDF